MEKAFTTSQQHVIDTLKKLEKKILRHAGLTKSDHLQIHDVEIEFLGTQKIHTITFGDPQNPPLVLMPGYGGFGNVFYRFFKPLASKFKVYCVDTLGFGLSSRAKLKEMSAQETVDYFVESFEAWRKAIKLEKFAFAGHSLGGYVSCMYALKYPERVSTLLPMSPVGLTDPIGGKNFEERFKEMSFFKRQAMKIVKALWSKKIVASDFVKRAPTLSGWLFKIGLQVKTMSEEEMTLLFEYGSESSKLEHTFEDCIYNLFEPGSAQPIISLENKMIHELKVPTVCFYGSRDWVDTAGALRIKKKLGANKFDIVMIEDAGHELPQDGAKDITAAIIKTLG